MESSAYGLSFMVVLNVALLDSFVHILRPPSERHSRLRSSISPAGV